MNDFLQLNNLGGDLKKLYDAVRGGKPTTAFSLATGAKMHVCTSLDAPVLFVALDRLAAADAYEKFQGFAYGRVALLAEKDDLLIHRSAYSIENTSKRIEALTKLSCLQADITVVSAEALLQYLPNVSSFKSSLLTLKTNDEIEMSKLVSRLVQGGYVRLDMAKEKGSFSLRGDILDIYPLSFSNPVRINFFDTLIETIKIFDAETMESIEALDSVIIPPSSDILLSENEAKDVIEKLSAVKANGYVAEIIEDIVAKLENNPNDYTLIWALPFMSNLSTVFDYLPENAVVIFDEPKLLSDKLDLLIKEHLSRVKSLTEGNSLLEKHKNSIISKSEIFAQSSLFRRLAFQQLTSINPIFEAKAQFAFRTQALTRYYLDNNALVTDLKNFIYNNYRVILCCSDTSRANTVANSLKQSGIMTYVTDELWGAFRQLP